MKQFYGEKKIKNYFEGWYFKQQIKDYTIAFIPSFHILKNGKKTAYLQVITKEGSYHFSFPAEAFESYSNYLYVKIDSNIFSKHGLSIHLKSDDISIDGNIYFKKFLPPNYTIMGPFEFIPFLQCKHSIISLSHAIYGNLKINNKEINFQNGIGYIEKDRGNSFPSAYLWIQSNFFTNQVFSIMIAAAKIPIAGFTFMGCIVCIYYKGKEYRIATYLGAKILLFQKNKIIITQGKFLLIATLLENHSCSLKAPKCGKMSYNIKESLISIVHYEFYYNSHKVFDTISNQASFEFFYNK